MLNNKKSVKIPKKSLKTPKTNLYKNELLNFCGV